MCDLLSGWINIKTEAMECLSLTSHSETQTLAKWSNKDLEHWREFEWKSDGLVVRTHKDDEHEPAWYQAIIEARFKTRIAAINWAIERVNSIGGGLSLDGLTSAEGLVLPQSIGGGLSLSGLTSADGLVLPKSIGRWLYLDGLTIAERNRVMQSASC